MNDSIQQLYFATELPQGKFICGCDGSDLLKTVSFSMKSIKEHDFGGSLLA